MRREMLAADKVGSSFESYPPPLGDIECFLFCFVFFWGRGCVAGLDGLGGVWVEGLLSLFFLKRFPSSLSS